MLIGNLAHWNKWTACQQVIIIFFFWNDIVVVCAVVHWCDSQVVGRLYISIYIPAPTTLTERNQKLYKTPQMKLLDTMVREQATARINKEKIFLLDIVFCSPKIGWEHAKDQQGSNENFCRQSCLSTKVETETTMKKLEWTTKANGLLSSASPRVWYLVCDRTDQIMQASIYRRYEAGDDHDTKWRFYR